MAISLSFGQPKGLKHVLEVESLYLSHFINAIGYLKIAKKCAVTVSKGEVISFLAYLLYEPLVNH